MLVMIVECYCEVLELFVFCFGLVLVFFKTGFLCVAKAVPKLTLYTMLASAFVVLRLEAYATLATFLQTFYR